MAILTNDGVDLILRISDAVLPLAGMFLLVWIAAKIVEKIFKWFA